VEKLCRNCMHYITFRCRRKGERSDFLDLLFNF
jgi:hypothetical protein